MKRLTLPRLDGELSLIELGAGPPVLALPGITCPASTWLDLGRRIAARGRRVLLLDQRGRGLTTVTEGGFGLDELAGDVLAVLRDLDLRDVVLLGHSMGALVAARVAARITDATDATATADATARPHPNPNPPGTVRPILVDPPICPGGRPYPTPLSRYLDLIRDARSGRLTLSEARSLHPTWENAEPWFEALPTCREEAVAAAHRDFHDGVFLSRWPALSATLLYGAHSDVVTPRDVALLRRANPRADIRPVENCGHMVPFERPDLLTKEFC
ncbi:alpha/beta hydrolase [Streptosporangium sp. NPDC051022]|uniref:alpha/beta fold hydrolase n=1 Tax=Streptosporangium sp. NPDC051022 TaxID=3155752 RepID=UPI00342F95CF